MGVRTARTDRVNQAGAAPVQFEADDRNMGLLPDGVLDRAAEVGRNAHEAERWLTLDNLGKCSANLGMSVDHEDTRAVHKV
jgi:hypothetical protein